MKKKKVTTYDKALANAVKKGEIPLNKVPKNKRHKIKNVMNSYSTKDLEKASRNNYKRSKRTVVKKTKNESMEKEDFKKIITNIEDWDDKVKGGLAKDKTPDDFDLDSLAAGAEIQMEHTDDPEVAIDIAMDHLEEHPLYYDEENGLESFEDELDDLEKDLGDEGINDEDEGDFDDNDEDFDEENNIENAQQMESSRFIKKFSTFKRVNEDNNMDEPVRYPKENKFKRVIEYSKDVEDSLVEHNFQQEGDSGGQFIVLDILKKTYYTTDEQPDDIRPCDDGEFDHIMDNL